MEIPSSLKKMTKRERLMILLGSGIIIIYLLFYVIPSEQVIVTPTVPIKKAAVPVKVPTNSIVMPFVPQKEQTMRNPFAIVPEIKEQKDTISPTSQSSGNLVGIEKNSIKQEKEILKLTGLIGTPDNRLAVIRSANNSKAYQKNAFIGSYQLIATNEDSVILENNEGQIVLRLGAATQKGGSKGAK